MQVNFPMVDDITFFGESFQSVKNKWPPVWRIIPHNIIFFIFCFEGIYLTLDYHHPAFWPDAHWLLSTSRIRLSRWFDFYDGVFRFDFYRKFCSAKVSEYFTPHHRRPELCIQSDLEALKYFLRAKIRNIS